MLISLFFLAAAADCIAHVGGRFVRAITQLLRPSTVLIATTLVLGTLGYWFFRNTQAELERAERDVGSELPISVSPEP